eukprot:749821-Hanusia_phi.AAC.3
MLTLHSSEKRDERLQAKQEYGTKGVWDTGNMGDREYGKQAGREYGRQGGRETGRQGGREGGKGIGREERRERGCTRERTQDLRMLHVTEEGVGGQG